MERKSFLLGLAAPALFAAGFFAGHRYALRDARPPELFLVQAAVASGLGLAGQAKTFVSAYYDENGRFPSSNAEAGIPDDVLITGPHVSSVTVGAGGAITVTYTGEPHIQGKTLVLAPSVVGDNYSLTWSCKGGTLPPEHRPDVCR